jgi:ABC-2 type transport system permease protein
MSTLLLKDFWVLNKRTLWMFLYLIAMVVLIPNFWGPVPLVFLVTFALIGQSGLIDDKNKIAVTLNSLPLRRRDIVVSRYLTALIYNLMGLAIYAVTAYMARRLFPTREILQLSLGSAVATITFTAIIAALYLPLYYRFGQANAQLLNMVFMFVPFFAMGLITMMYAKGQLPWLTPVVHAVTILPYPLRITGIVVIAAVVVFISISISIRVYHSREC